MASIFGTLSPGVAAALNRARDRKAASATPAKTVATGGAGTTKGTVLSPGAITKGSVGTTKAPSTRFGAAIKSAFAYGITEEGSRLWADKTAAKIYSDTKGKGAGGMLAGVAELAAERKAGWFQSEQAFKDRAKILGVKVKKSDAFWGAVKTAGQTIAGGVTSAAGGAGRAAQQFQTATVAAAEAAKQPEVSTDPNVGSQTVNPDGTVSTQAGDQTMGGDPFSELASSDVGQWAQSESPIAGVPWYLVLLAAGIAIYYLLHEG